MTLFSWSVYECIDVFTGWEDLYRGGVRNILRSGTVLSGKYHRAFLATGAP